MMVGDAQALEKLIENTALSPRKILQHSFTCTLGAAQNAFSYQKMRPLANSLLL